MSFLQNSAGNMTFRVEVTAEAQRDADAIYEWLVLQHAGETGLRWFSALEIAINSLRNFPERCSIAPDLHHLPFEVRQLLYGNRPHIYRILFAIRYETVYVLNIRHGRRQPVKQL
jgi:plasmid stabilization system protein ParE